MIVYSEKKFKQQSIFLKTILDNGGNEVSVRKVSIPLFQIEKDDFTYFILYDDNMNVIKEAYEYLNHDMKDMALNSRSKSAFALRLLYCFLSLSGYSIKTINDYVLKELIFFLRGIDTNPKKYAIKTHRAGRTVNSYLSIYRAFFSKRKIKCEAIFKSHTTTTTTNINNDYQSTTQRKRYDSNLKTPGYSINTVPKYISPDDFRKLYSLAIKNNDNTAKLIMHLMYGYGLRLGEVLGITMEDIIEGYDNGNLIPMIILRNRISDKRFQYSKNLSHVIDKEQYNSSDYRLSKHKIIITYELYEELLEYIEETHSTLMDKYPDNYEKGVADIVSVRNKPETNHYVFLNRYGRVLSDQTWNNSLKQYFKDAKIPLDYDVRENNLSHRFRHGFAMFHARFSSNPVDVLVLQKLMRHKSISSTMVYYNPTPEDEFEIKTDFQKELYNMIPELKRNLTSYF
ncbi:site-specific integrase [Clostridium perfringens]|nr:site-specific integrase [Clostridium perfringens]EJT6161779.1 site-specific integrase [Clostridium perfringens]EJT6504260.1 site-specific integrase [Clostridium perfringens]MDK0565407.1 site-specific integrase [Clostridium perfringens]MDM0643071.1 site-specific integrase [Clostridium perfringens]